MERRREVGIIDAALTELIVSGRASGYTKGNKEDKCVEFGHGHSPFCFLHNSLKPARGLCDD